MSKKAYRAFIVFACVVVIIAIALAIGLRYWSPLNSQGQGTPQQTTHEPAPSITASTEDNDRQTLPEDSTFEIHFFDVGEGDSALVVCDGHYLLIDGGEAGYSRFLYSYLQQNKITFLDYIVCSHEHSDHVGGLAGALNYAQVGTAYAPVTEYDTRAFNSFVKYLNAGSKEIVIPSPGDIIYLGSAYIEFLAPLDMTLAETNANNSSIILRVVYGNTSFLFTGDAEMEEEKSLVDSGAEIHSTLLKVGHHGSYTSSSELFLSSVDPQYAIISVGKNNEYGHPNAMVLDRLLKRCTVYRTDVEGTIVCYSDGNKLSFSMENN